MPGFQKSLKHASHCSGRIGLLGSFFSTLGTCQLSWENYFLDFQSGVSLPVPCLFPVAYLRLELEDNELLAPVPAQGSGENLCPSYSGCAHHHFAVFGYQQDPVQFQGGAFLRRKVFNFYDLARGDLILFCAGFDYGVNSDFLPTDRSRPCFPFRTLQALPILSVSFWGVKLARLDRGCERW